MNIKFITIIVSMLALAACVPEGALPVTQSAKAPPVDAIKCAAPIGKIAVRDLANAQLAGMLTSIGVDSPANALRVIAQHSNCFEVRDIGIVEQRLAALRQESDRVGARRAGRTVQLAAGPLLGETIWVLQPSLSANLPSITAASGAGAPMRANVAPVAGQQAQDILGIAAPALRNAAANVSLMLVELESGRQVGVAQGDHAGADIDIAAALLGPQARGLGSGYSQTPEGRTILIALQKAFNALVEDLNARPDFAATGLAAAAAQPAAPERVAPAYRANADYVVATGVNFRAAPINGAVKRQLYPGARVQTTDRRQDGWWEVEVDGETGWVASQFLRNP